MGVKVPTPAEAERILAESASVNPGPWVEHCHTAGACARALAERHQDMDPDVAYVLGLLHDLGRRSSAAGIPDVMHILDGYRVLTALGYDDAARICLTHSFPIRNADVFASPWVGPRGELHDEKRFVQSFLDGVEYTAYDRLIQLCDSLSLPSGPVLLEKRLVDVALRHGFNTHTVDKWRAFIAIKAEFDAACGGSIYSVLDGVVQNTFGNARIGPD
ncbi:MAG TPA: HD domain-containing protein [Chloroflexota bacterium]|nr:HD domain-containing protein [Chloroflexota bacterium]